MASASVQHLKEIIMTLKITPTNIVLKMVFVFLLFSAQINAQSILNNGQRRIGSGEENSINAEGNMQQPFYYNNSQSVWRKLTYQSYPLDIRWGVGGDGTNNWNINGDFADNPTLSNIVYDYSGFTPITNTATRDELGGTGVIKVSGNITVNGQLFLIENSYTLGSTDGFFRVKTKITNQSGSTATNVRLWVGTRDDWIGETDQPTKERGNLVDGVFTIIPTQATQAKAIKVYSGDEAILMFSNSPRAYSTIAGYGPFTNATNTDPSANTISIQNDGSYAVYARFNDLASNQSDQLDWYYAAGTIAEIEDIIRKVAEAASAVSNITHNSADYSYSATQSGTTSYVLVPAGSTVPTAAQVEAGVNYTGGTVISSSSIASVANTAHTYNFTGLIASTNYTIYAVTKYNDGVSDVFTSVQTTNFATIAQPTGLTKHGEITTDAAKIVNGNGGIGTGKGLNIFGEILDTPVPPKNGDTYQGGIVFDTYVDEFGVTRGLIASTADQAKTSWDNRLSVAAAYRGGGYTDWRLPHTNEFAKLYNQRDLPGLAGTFKTGNIDNYWPSNNLRGVEDQYKTAFSFSEGKTVNGSIYYDS